ncbi:UNVERIFIED_CONTAM: Phosphoinositide phosphatase SAC8 [Sesamum radiatum]|uniref:Phosphoinositide phosphatase SAC8 n=1 Tax=Sesamum radiatum TaxID=300843 RepID=A0AAW2R5S5_SESRA
MESNSTSRFKLWSELVLEEYTEKFVIKSVESPDQGFSISRLDGNIDKLNSDDPSGSSSKVSTIYGVAGTIRLLAGTYVLVITSRKEVGTYLGFPVFLVTSMKFLSCNGASRFLTSQEKRDEDYYMTLLKIVESTPGLYFSYGTDITLKVIHDLFGIGICWRNLLKTRYGKQTMAGIIKDGMSALSRYYLNNFQDGVRQYLPVASALLVGGLTVTSITLNQAGRQAHQYLSSVICAGLTAGVMAVIKSNGRQICSRPRLCGLL